MAAGGPGGHAARRHAGRLAHRRGPAGPMVVVRGGDRRVHRRVGMAAARGPALMGAALWERLARVFGRGARERREAERILLAAADTFRAGAAEQLLVWADRLGVPCITGTKDPAAVAFDAIAAARARGVDTVLVDTAGRLHTEARLLAELKKVVRVVAKQQAG